MLQIENFKIKWPSKTQNYDAVSINATSVC